MIKIAVTLLMVVLAYVFYKLSVLGRLARSDVYKIEDHKWWANLAIVLVIAAVIVIEGMVRVGGMSKRDWWFNVHLSLAIAGAISLIIARFLMNGRQSRDYHKYVAYICILAFGGAIPTGLYLLWR